MDVHNAETLILSIIFLCFSIMLTVIGFLGKVIFNFVWNKQIKNDKDINALWIYVRSNGRQSSEQPDPQQEPQEKRR